jgi:hypothetical protein
VTEQEKEAVKEFMAFFRTVPSHKIALAMTRMNRGINFGSCTKGMLAEAWAERNSSFRRREIAHYTLDGIAAKIEELYPAAPTAPIPIAAAADIAKRYGYDQVIVYARRIGEDPQPHGEHLTTYGVTREHCDVAAKIGHFLRTKIMGWAAENENGEKQE